MAGTDYANLGTSVVIPAGAVAATIAVNVMDDAVYEGSETVVVTLTANSAYSIGSSSNATVTIADDDKRVVSIVATDAVAARYRYVYSQSRRRNHGPAHSQLRGVRYGH
jgi:hypothetical protein